MAPAQLPLTPHSRCFRDKIAKYTYTTRRSRVRSLWDSAVSISNTAFSVLPAASVQSSPASTERSYCNPASRGGDPAPRAPYTVESISIAHRLRDALVPMRPTSHAPLAHPRTRKRSLQADGARAFEPGEGEATAARLAIEGRGSRQQQAHTAASGDVASTPSEGLARIASDSRSAYAPSSASASPQLEDGQGASMAAPRTP
ncbi:hypothetical protein BKA93DRAFT_827010 [Sparassis latifolia]